MGPDDGSDSDIEKTRTEWRARLAQNPVARRDVFERDKISKSITGRLPDDIKDVRRLADIVTECRRILEEEFVEAYPSSSVDPDRDVDAVRTLVGRLMVCVRATGPTFAPAHAIRSWRSPGESDAPTYAILTQYERRRWRVAFMRFLDLCASHSDGIPDLHDVQQRFEDGDPDQYEGDVEIAIAIEQLPFHIHDFRAEELDAVFAAWRVRQSGAKPLKEDPSDQLQSKWVMLERLFKKSWGEKEKTWKAIQTEWLRYGDPQRTSRTSGKRQRSRQR